ncbi:MAG: hypothetical protein WA990_12355 [Rubrobacteraceae bacterium]
MHKRIVFAVSAVLFAIMAATAVIVADLHDRDAPVRLGARSSVSLDFADSGMSDQEAFRQLGRLSDRLGLGLVKVAPDLGGDQSGQVFIVVGDQDSFPEMISRFGDQPDAQIRDSVALENSYANGQYLVTGETARLADFEDWLADNRVAGELNDDSLGNVLRLLVAQSSFVTSLLATAALMVSLVLYWLSIKAKGRALRVLAGVSTWRIQYEDLVGFLATISAAASLCGLVAVTYVGLAYDWVFVPYYAWALLIFYTAVIVATMACAVVISVASWPSAKMLAAREPAVKSLRKVSVVLKASTFALVLVAVTPAFTAYTDAKTVAAEQAQWKSLADQVALSFDVGMDESSFQQLMPSVGELVKESEERDAIAMSYTWDNEMVNGDLEPYAYLSLVNQRWLDLMLGEGGDGGHGGSQPESDLVPVTRDQVPDRTRQQLLGEQLELWLRDRSTADETLSKMSFYRHAGTDKFPMALGGGGGDLEFSNDAIIVVAPSVNELFNDDFLTSAASTSNLVFTGLGPTQALVEQHGLQKEVYVKYVAEEGVLLAQLTAYFAWLQGISLVALVAALVVAALIGAFITAVLKARRDFPLRLAGKRWIEILAGRVIKEWAVGIALAALVILVRGLDGGLLIAVVAMAGLLASPLIHIVAARWAFANVSLRRL